MTRSTLSVQVKRPQMLDAIHFIHLIVYISQSTVRHDVTKMAGKERYRVSREEDQSTLQRPRYVWQSPCLLSDKNLKLNRFIVPSFHFSRR